MRNIKVVIPAAGKSKRSKLNYPKCLYPLHGTPIIINNLRKLIVYDKNPIIIINPTQESKFKEELNKYNIAAEFVYQNEPKGMGHAIVSTRISKQFNQSENFLLLWSDLLFVNTNTLDNIIKIYFEKNFDLVFPTIKIENPYTIVKRNRTGQVISLIETKLKPEEKLKYGEREIGVFLFNKEIFENLESYVMEHYDGSEGEIGFLSFIENLVKANYKIDGIEIATLPETLSFNSPEDLTKAQEILENKKND